MTNSQRKALETIRAMGWNIISTTANDSLYNKRMRVGVCNKESVNDPYAMVCSLYVGKRGRIYDTEYSDY